MGNSKNKVEQKEKPVIETSIEKPTLEIKHKEKKKKLSGFDLEEFTAKPFDGGITTEKEITSILVGKPNKQKFFRAHPDLAFLTYVIKWERDGLEYIIHPDVLKCLEGHARLVMLYVCIYTTGTVFLFVVNQPDEQGQQNNFHKSRAIMVEKAKKSWIRIEANMEAQGYEAHVAKGALAEPDWPDLSMSKYLEIAFRGRIIKDENHPVIKSLQGLTE